MDPLAEVLAPRIDLISTALLLFLLDYGLAFPNSLGDMTFDLTALCEPIILLLPAL
jgi:hypothetical protein